MFDFLFEALGDLFGEIVLDLMCRVGSFIVQELIHWAKDVF